MSCSLDKYTNYTIKEVLHDAATNHYIVKLQNPPRSCPDGTLNNSHTIVERGAGVPSPTLSFSAKQNAPVALLPSGVTVKELVDPIDVPKSGFGFWGWLTIILVVGFIAWVVYAWIKSLKRVVANPYECPIVPTPSSRTQPEYAPHGQMTPERMANFERQQQERPATTYCQPVFYSPPTPVVQHTTIVRNESNSDFLTGMLVADALSDHHSHSHHDTYEREVIHEREIIHDSPVHESRESSFSSDDDDEDRNKSSYSSDSSDSYSSDSSSSYGSDSSDSYASDSGSSFGSDD